MPSGAGASHKQTNLLSFVLISSQATEIYWSHQHSETKDTKTIWKCSLSHKSYNVGRILQHFLSTKSSWELLLFIDLWSVWENGECNTCYFQLSVLFSESPRFRQNRNLSLWYPPAKSIFFLFFHKKLRVGIFFSVALSVLGERVWRMRATHFLMGFKEAGFTLP